jgi:hypothetical protein
MVAIFFFLDARLSLTYLPTLDYHLCTKRSTLSPPLTYLPTQPPPRLPTQLPFYALNLQQCNHVITYEGSAINEVGCSLPFLPIPIEAGIF